MNINDILINIFKINRNVYKIGGYIQNGYINLVLVLNDTKLYKFTFLNVLNKQEITKEYLKQKLTLKYNEYNYYNAYLTWKKVSLIDINPDTILYPLSEIITEIQDNTQIDIDKEFPLEKEIRWLN